MTNSDSWQAVEQKLFEELLAMAAAYEANKSLTGEPLLKGGLHEVKRNCRYLA